jgi:hypothetical protein
MFRFRFLPIAIVVLCNASKLRAQDARTIAEPTFPTVCAVYRAPLTSDATGPFFADPSQEDNESLNEAATLQSRLQTCPRGQAVELTLGEDSQHSAFLITPISLPVGVSLIVDGGVTLYASRNPRHYQVPDAPATCGEVSSEGYVNGVCQPLITFLSDGTGANNGLYGYGVIDGQGNNALLVQPKFPSNFPACTQNKPANCTWWDLIAYKDTNNKGYNENSPYTL